MSRAASKVFNSHFLPAAIALILIIAVAPAHADEERRYAEVRETSSSPYYGTDADWTDENWGCPTKENTHYVVSTWINVTSGEIHTIETPAGQASWKPFVQLGHHLQKDRDGTGRCTVLRNRYYWERLTSGHKKILIETPVPMGSRHFTLSRSGDCVDGNSWCWHFRIDGNRVKRCCGGFSKMATGRQVLSAIECTFNNNHYTNCPGSGGPLTFDLMEYKKGDGTWPAWAGKDQHCVNYAKGMRGKWVDGDSAKVGIKIDIGGSLKGC
jgi:hypothetical protein